MPMERLSPLDASFLRAETPSAHMHVGWLAIVDAPKGGGPLDAGLLARRIESRLSRAPRFRKRVVDVPVGEPPLIDDPSFSISRHVRTLPAAEGGLTDAELQDTLDAFLSTQLNRAKPLWEIAVVPRLRRGGGAILGKVHHALVDGVAAVELGTLLFDLGPDTEIDELPGDAGELEAEQPPSPVRLLIDSATDTALEQFRTAGRMANLGLRPTHGLRVADSMRRAAFQVAREIAEPAPPSYLNGPIGPDRTLRTTTLPLDRVLAVKDRSAGKLNDIVLALVSGALHEFSILGDREPGPLRAMIPINVRGGAGSGPAEGEGNRIAFGFVELPVAAADPLARLRSVRRQSSALRGSGRAAGSDALMQSVGMLPGPIKSIVTRAASSSRTFNLTVSNVPGPRFPLYAAGSRVRSIFPVIPLAGSHALAIGVLTYEGGLHVALHADPVSLPGAEALPDLFARALDDLEEALRESGGEPRRVRTARPAAGAARSRR
jgi:diacylglycerol O-acyltransferase / wax synthase